MIYNSSYYIYFVNYGAYYVLCGIFINLFFGYSYGITRSIVSYDFGLICGYGICIRE